MQRDAIELRLALTDARRRLAQLYGGSNADALQAQMEIIRDDVGPGHKSLDKGLWVPLQAEVEHFLLRAPEPVRTAARRAVEKGRAATERGERRAAREQLDVLLDVLQYQVQVFPLRPVRGDVESAITSGFLATPDWEATRQALESALSQVRWFAREQADGLLDAYYQVANAYGARPDTKQVAGYLRQAADDLIAVPEEQALARELKRAAQSPTRKGLADLLSRLRDRIQIQQRRDSSAPHEKPFPIARIGKPLRF